MHSTWYQSSNLLPNIGCSIGRILVSSPCQLMLSPCALLPTSNRLKVGPKKRLSVVADQVCGGRVHLANSAELGLPQSWVKGRALLCKDRAVADRHGLLAPSHLKTSHFEACLPPLSSNSCHSNRMPIWMWPTQQKGCKFLILQMLACYLAAVYKVKMAANLFAAHTHTHTHTHQDTQVIKTGRN